MVSSEHPDVINYRQTLRRIEEETLPQTRQSQMILDRTMVARNQRKELERAAATLLNDESIVEDTGEYPAVDLKAVAVGE